MYLYIHVDIYIHVEKLHDFQCILPSKQIILGKISLIKYSYHIKISTT